jgi:peptide-methionine (S)-S-oxide reductase
MDNSEITDPLFREAVEAIDTGNVPVLKKMLQDNPQLVSSRLNAPTEGYFQHPYLLWFVADNPIRHDRLPSNIVEVTRLLIDAVRKNAGKSFQEQIDYALGLVATGRIPKESGVQIELIDLLIDAGARPGNGHGALAHGNREAAERLIERGGNLTLTTAIGLGREKDVKRLLLQATGEDKQIALVASAYFGNPEMLRCLISSGVDVNAYIDQSSGFHSHATALHQAVYSGSLDSVKILVEAGANLNLEDRVYQGTPLGWAQYLQREEKDENLKEKYSQIEKFLLTVRPGRA